jgi:DNA-binding transcriptional LysR family regulator
MSDRLADLGLFLRVFDLGSISAAARSLGISTAAASQRVQRLERALGVQLLHRTTRRLAATREGAELAARGRPLIDDLDALTAGLRGDAGEVSGVLRLTAPASFGRLYLSPVLPEFLARHPRLSIQAHLSDDVVDVVGRGLDIALRIGALDPSSLVARRLADDRRVLVASPSYLSRRGVPRTPSELARHDCLILNGSAGAHDLWRLRDSRGRELAVRVTGRFESSLGEVLRDAAVAGLGVALHSEWLVCDDVRAGRLVRVLPGHTPPSSGIYAVTPPRRLMPERVRAFIAFLVEQFGAAPPWQHRDTPRASRRPRR